MTMPPFAQPAPPAPRPADTGRVLDIILTVLFLGVLLAGSGFIGLLTLYGFSMSTDSCYGDRCREEFVMPALLVEWGSIALGVLVAFGGVIYGAVRRRLMLVWPLVGIGLVLVGTAIAFALIDYAVGR
ncbi:hypothetical protein [Mycolicibacterium confluentis]|uniref:hypothetical protein n=1 Tax=Mycolicibacterium confluentis TaxID=28047 RepID=UPI0010555198|nr:hypothetical protein [Mycolicibacterium confluentis]